MRIYDTRIGKFLSVDPIAENYPELTPYQFASNRPIDGIDLDGLEFYYSNDLFHPGWKESTKLRPPPIMMDEEYKEEYYNSLGYLTLKQKVKIQSDIDYRKRIEEDAEARRRFNEGIVAYVRAKSTDNPFILAYELSPLGAFVASYQAFSEGDNFAGTLNAVFTLTGFSELRSLGLGKFSSVSELFNSAKIASTSLDELWQVTNNLIRGTLIENKLAQTLYKTYEHLGVTVSKFFKTIDFYDASKQLGISLKSVNAKANFEFKNIIKNIDALAHAKNIGVIQSNGTERIIKNVRLDIVVPKGYDQKVLDKVRAHAKTQKVDIEIFEQ